MRRRSFPLSMKREPRAHISQIGPRPKNTPKEVIATINAAVIIALADTTAQARFADLGTNVPPPDHQTPEWLAEFHKNEFDRWWPILKAL
jgi:tripartite-type tricarboxylate transporter receptor subunit TctC